MLNIGEERTQKIFNCKPSLYKAGKHLEGLHSPALYLGYMVTDKKKMEDAIFYYCSRSRYLPVSTADQKF